MTSVNENALSYLQSRIRLMEFGTNIPFSVLIQGLHTIWQNILMRLS